MTVKTLGILKVVPILKIIQETSLETRMPVKSFSFKIPEITAIAQPGQYVMMWLHGIDEKPMGIASCNMKTGEILFAVAKIGPTTTAFHKLKEGDLLGIRGPFGKGFPIKGKNVAIIGGGTGIAPTRFLIEKLLESNISTTLYHGAQTEKELAFKKYFENLEAANKIFSYKPSTDDGTFGFHGFSTECLSASLDEGDKFDQLYTCGPELMMYAAFQIAQENKMPIEACLADRHFKCAIGLCGQCSVDPIGLRLCIDGPVFNQDQLKQITDFGKYARDKYGRKEPF
ncbi:MAG: dihydroorotate dehydrogenase electron transfer subunit [Asgard group archaeon]|nr:dihydroorotate dehydrogenase electron transfer subunit [Asgard group archaeon]